MSKKQEAAPRKEKKAKAAKSTVLKVSKSAKIIAAMGSLRGFNFSQTIRILGEAEASYKAGGRLMFGL